VKVELETYARESGNVIVKPFVLVIARDITHAKQLKDLIQTDAFFEGHYKDKVIQVDSSKTGAEEDAMVERLLKVEQTTPSTLVPEAPEPPVFNTPESQKVAQLVYQEIRKLGNQPTVLPSVSHLTNPDVQAAIIHDP